jgi:hypothetical protein
MTRGARLLQFGSRRLGSGDGLRGIGATAARRSDSVADSIARSAFPGADVSYRDFGERKKNERCLLAGLTTAAFGKHEINRHFDLSGVDLAGRCSTLDFRRSRFTHQSRIPLLFASVRRKNSKNKKIAVLGALSS